MKARDLLHYRGRPVASDRRYRRHIGAVRWSYGDVGLTRPAMSRAALLAELAGYEPVDAHELAMTTELAAFVSGQPHCFERTLQAGHITASAWVVDNECSHVLLTHHRKLGRWLQLGGHADGDPDIRRVAFREACEESGLTTMRFARTAIYDIDVHVIPARAAEPAHKHYDVRFAFFADRAEPTRVSAESHALAWRRLDTLDAADFDASVCRLARKTPTLAAAP